MEQSQKADDVIVIGAGLGGLVSAALCARRGLSVRVLERASQPGGRARSREQEGFVFNLGAHALFNRGPMQRVLREFDITPQGRTPDRAPYLLYKDQLHLLPATPWALWNSPLTDARGKWALITSLLSLGERKAQRYAGLSVSQWIERQTDDAATRAILAMFARLSCYAYAHDQLSATSAIRQMAHALRYNVQYLDGGWQPIVDALHDRARSAGAVLQFDNEVSAIEHSDSQVTSVLTRDGQRYPARTVIAAIKSSALSAVLPDDKTAAQWAQTAVPLRAACLDLGVRELPYPERWNVQHLEAPLYFAIHSDYARLAPEGTYNLQLVRYLSPDEDGRGAEPELRAFLERIQPGCYERAIVKRFMPNLVVHHDLPSAERAHAAHPEIAGLYLVGDSASSEYMLANAVFDSATHAVDRVRTHLASPLSAARQAAQLLAEATAARSHAPQAQASRYSA